jgi:hypothetical protein
MLERPCYQKLDEPVLVWLGLEFREISLSLLLGAGTSVIGGFVLGLGFPGVLLGFGVGAGLLILFRSLHAGGPGAVFAHLYRLGLVEWLPSGLRPRHLLPLPRGARRGIFRLSPVLGEVHQKGDLDGRRYFGR